MSKAKYGERAEMEERILWHDKPRETLYQRGPCASWVGGVMGYKKVHISELTTPFDGATVKLNRYWLMTDNDEALFYISGIGKRKELRPQCNRDKAILQHIRILDTYPRFIPIAYIKEE
jgi:hypothetical protein